MTTYHDNIRYKYKRRCNYSSFHHKRKHIMDNLEAGKISQILGYGAVEDHNSSSDDADDLPLLNDSKLNRLRRTLFPCGFKQEFKRLMQLAVPVIFTNLFQFIIPTESISMCGHLSTEDLNGVALANSMINAFGISVSTGLCTACDTLFSQAFGSSDKRQVGVFLQRSIYVNSLCMVLLWCLYLNSLPIFILLGQAPQVAAIASKYMQIFMPGLLFQINYLMTARYLQNQECVYPPLIVGAIGNVFNIFSQYLALHQLHFGFEASAVLQAATYFVMWLGELVYILKTRFYKKTWGGWSAEALFDWGHFLKLAIPGVGHVALEEILWEICVFIAGTLGAVQLASQSILFQTELFGYMIPVGMGVAINIRVGQFLGANKPSAAKNAVNVAIVSVMALISVLVILLLAFAQYIPLIFTEDQSIKNMTIQLFPLLALTFFTDGFLGVSNGALRGCGRQRLGAITIFFGYYVIGFPIAMILVYVGGLDLWGIWTGMVIGLLIMTICNTIILYKTSWAEQAEAAQQRLNIHAIDIPSKEKNFQPENHVKERLLGHVRASSHPIGCSTEQVRLPPLRSRVNRHEFIKIIRKRMFQILPLFLLLIGAAVLGSCLPRNLYWPKEYKNDTLVNTTVTFDIRI